ncbi:Uncharacterised protein [Yersinia intermedia]|uniref:WbuC family cupin fold metalloprotein n=1 Tax=Yersinia intermedia TaxID=631 RepID=UPI0005DF2178|nr:WbuC family cupin fold metalloprotein [Yersinia intermedia]CNI50054.1 Uncharacterised protein [Yersinia intermedia]
MLIFDDDFKKKLYEKAKHSVRKRMHHNIHNDLLEPVQRLAIALLKGTYIPPHKHVLEKQWEFFHVIEGDLKFVTFSDSGQVTQSLYIGASSGIFAMQIPPNIIHSLVCMSERAMIFEWKEGPFSPEQAKYILPWAIPEGDSRVPDMVRMLEVAKLGDDIHKHN